MNNEPPARPQFEQDTSWALHAENEKRWLLDCIEWLAQRVALLTEEIRADR